MAKDLLFFLVERDGRVRQVVNDVVTSLAQRRSLSHAPMGSQDVTIGWERSAQWWGNIRNFGIPLGFPFEGGRIIRNDAYKFNVDRELYLLILRFVSEIDAVYYKDYYKFLYKGQLDFSTFNDRKGDAFVEIGIMEGGLNKILKSQSTIQFDVPLDDEAIDVYHDGILLSKKANFFIAEVELDNGTFWGSSFTPLSLKNVEGSANGVAFFSQSLEITNTATLAQRAASPNIFAEAGPTIATDITVHITGKINFKCTQHDGGFGFGINILKSDQTDVALFNDAILVEGQSYSHDIDVSIDLTPGMSLHMEEILSVTGNVKVQFEPGSDLSVEYEYREAPTLMKVHKPYVMYKKLCAKMGIEESKIISEALQACTFCLTSGDGVRGLENSNIPTTFANFFKAYSILLMAGVAIESDKLVFEKFDHFFVPDSVLAATELGTAKNVSIKEAVDQFFSSIKVGHQEQNVDDVNGKFDFNGYQIWKSPQKTVTRELDLQTPYKAGPYEIEVKRFNLEGKTTTDDQVDNDIFLIDVDVSLPDVFDIPNISFLSEGNFITLYQLSPRLVEGAKFTITGSTSNDTTYTVTRSYVIGNAQIIYTDITITNAEFNIAVTLEILEGKVYELDRSTVVTSGVPSPETIYNVRLSPKRILITWFTWIRSFLYKFDAEQLTLESKNRNIELVAGGITEKDPINIDEMGEPIARPFYIEHGTQVPISLAETLEDTPNRCFATIIDDVRYTGYLWNAALAPVSRGEQTFKHLMTSENDPTDLI